ncbi:UNVERIFIED_CONTAM: hypothetical protein RKD50_008655 [Streptomyces canus]
MDPVLACLEIDDEGLYQLRVVVHHQHPCHAVVRRAMSAGGRASDLMVMGVGGSPFALERPLPLWIA